MYETFAYNKYEKNKKVTNYFLFLIVMKSE